MRKALACSVSLLALGCAVALAATPVTGEIAVNTTVAGSQDQPSVALDADGDFAVTWEDGTGPTRAIQLRRFTRAGAATTLELPMDGAADSQDPAVAMSATGDGVVAWQSGAGGQTVARRFDANSAEGLEIPVNASTATEAPDVAMDADGDFVVVWEDNAAEDAVIRAQRFTEAGVADGSVITVNGPAAPGTKSLDPAIAIDNAGDFVVAWERPSGDNDDVIARVFNADGSPSTGELTVASGAADQDDVESAMDADGDFAVGWESGDDVLARRYSSTGTPTTSAFPVNSTTTGAQGNVRVGLDAGGGSLAATWDSDAGGDDEVVARRFSTSGAPLSGEVAVNTTDAGDQGDPGLGIDASGRFVVAWETDGTATDVFARVFDPVTMQQPPPGGGGNSPCDDPARILVSCQIPSGQFTIPGVCGPSFGTILPACNIPTYPPVVCGPSFGTILNACQLPQSKIIACGGFGTILPQCNNPPSSVPGVCGGGGTLLPKCTGANQLALACGPSTGTPLPACNFPTKIKATPLQTGKGATVTVDTGCAPSGATTSAAGRGARAAQKGPDTCDVNLMLRGMRVSLWETLAFQATQTAHSFLTDAHHANEFIELRETLTEAQKQSLMDANLALAGAAARVFIERVNRLLPMYLGPTRVADEMSVDQLYEYLTRQRGNPPYPPETDGQPVGGPIKIWARAFENAVGRYRQLEGIGAGKKSSVGAAQVKRPSGGLLLRKRYKLRTGRKRGSKRRGKTRKIKIKLSKRTVNKLVREAAKSKGSKRVIPLRLVISYRGKLRGRRIPVARFIDVQLRVKPKSKRKKR